MHQLAQSGTQRYCNSLADVSSLQNCISLEKLNLSGCTALRNVDALGGCPSLDDLDLGGCTGLHNVDALVQCLRLRQLNLTDSGVSDMTHASSCNIMM